MADAIILSVKLESGGFNSEMRIPLPLTKEVCEAAVRRWIDIMKLGLEAGLSEVTAVLPVEAESGSC